MTSILKAFLHGPRHGSSFPSSSLRDRVNNTPIFKLKVKFVTSSSGIRDYIHVMDLASGHVAALSALKKKHLRLKVSVSVDFFLTSL